MPLGVWYCWQAVESYFAGANRSSPPLEELMKKKCVSNDVRSTSDAPCRLVAPTCDAGLTEQVS